MEAIEATTKIVEAYFQVGASGGTYNGSAMRSGGNLETEAPKIAAAFKIIFQ